MDGREATPAPQTPAETVREVRCHVCCSDLMDRRRGGVLRALHLRDQQGRPSLEGASDGGSVRHDPLMGTPSHRPRPGTRPEADLDEVMT